MKKNNDRFGLIKDMLKQNPEDSFLNYAAALEYKKKGESEKAIELIEALLQNDVNYLGGYYQLGKLYEEKGETEKAIDIYKRGKKIAQKTNDEKTLGELSEALMIIDGFDDNWSE